MTMTMTPEYAQWARDSAVDSLRQECTRLRRQAEELQADNRHLQKIIEGLAARVAAQSELLSAAAEKG